MYRRRYLATVGGMGLVGMAGCLGDDPPEEPAYGDFLNSVPHFDGFEDLTDQDQVTVLVGDGDNGMLYTPPAITVVPRTPVTFEWTGQGGEHDVRAEDAPTSWQNPEGLIDQEGHTWTREYEEPGTHLYWCWPHRGAGMRGAIFVDDYA